MAITAGETGAAQTTTSTTGDVMFTANTDGPNMRAVKIICPAASAVSILVNVEGVHKSDVWVQLDAGESETFTATRGGNAGGITKIRVKVASGTGTVSWRKVA